MEKRFRVLRTMGTIWKVLAWIELVVGVLVSVGLLVAGISAGAALTRNIPASTVPFWSYGNTAGFVGFVAALIATIIYFLLLYGVGELLYLLLSIEENTRQTSRQTDRLVQSASQPVPVPAPVGVTPTGRT